VNSIDPSLSSTSISSKTHAAIILQLFLFATALLPIVANGQFSAQFATDERSFAESSQTLQNATRIQRAWTVFGRVLNLGGDPIRAAKVTVDTGVGRPEVLETNLKGEFSTEVTATITQYEAFHVRVVASKEGYMTAQESADFTAKDNATREILVVLREDSENSELLSPAGLVSSLEARFRSPETLSLVPQPSRKDFEKGIEKLFSEGSYLDAVSSLTKSVNKSPGCVDCRLALGLAYLGTNSIVSADRQNVEVDKLTASGKMPRERATLLYIAGVVETWRHEYKNAAGFFLKALDLLPSDSNVLQELGRTLVLQQNWEAADDYLDKAIKAGASREAHLLRARALLEEGDVDGANAEMKTYLGKHPVRSLPMASRMTYLDLQQRLEVKSLSKVKSIVGQPIPELVKAMPELNGLETAASQEPLPSILQKVGENVEKFFRDFSNTVSEEDIRVENLRANGQVGEFQTQKFNYLLLARPEKWGPGLTEYRATPDGRSAQPMESRPGYMRTKGFASASLVFHPSCQGESSFRYLGREKMEGRETYVVAFAQQPEKAKRVGLIIMGETLEPVLVQGVAWVDAESYQIIRMRTDLLKPLQKVRLVRQTTEIQYTEVHFKDKPEAAWLPQVVTVTVQWKGKTFRNSHHYSDFKLFDVATREKRKQASLGPATGTSLN